MKVNHNNLTALFESINNKSESINLKIVNIFLFLIKEKLILIGNWLLLNSIVSISIVPIFIGCMV